MADLRILRPTGTRTLRSRFEQAPRSPFAVDRGGLAGSSFPGAETLAGFSDPVPSATAVVESADQLSAVVGLDVLSVDRPGPLRLRRLTTNTELRYCPVVRFDLRPLDTVGPAGVVEAQLFFREQPWLRADDDEPNAAEGCAAVSVGGAVLLGVPIAEAGLESRQPPLRFVAQGVAGEPITAGLPSVGVTVIVREWLERRRVLAGVVAEGTLAITPTPPQLVDPQLVGLPLLSNQRRKLHWVRERRWRRDGSSYRFRCLRRVLDLQIVVRVEA